jgi:hypothetical protein
MKKSIIGRFFVCMYVYIYKSIAEALGVEQDLLSEGEVQNVKYGIVMSPLTVSSISLQSIDNG